MPGDCRGSASGWAAHTGVKSCLLPVPSKGGPALRGRRGGTSVMATDSHAAADSDKPPSRLSRMLRRLTATEAELDAEELKTNAVQCGSMPASVCTRGQVVSVTGRLRT